MPPVTHDEQQTFNLLLDKRPLQLHNGENLWIQKGASFVMHTTSQSPLALYSDLRGKSVCVTGAARGLGLAISRQFLTQGAQVMLLDIDADEAQTAAAGLAAEFPAENVTSAAVSVSDAAGVHSALTAFAEQVGGLDIMVNNAGISANAPSLDLDLGLWNRCVDVNLTGVFIGAQAAARLMQAKKSGVIINTSSIFGLVSGPGRAAYCATKAAVASLTQVLAVEWAPLGIRVNALAPGYVETDLVTEVAAAGRIDLNEIRSRTPIGRLGSEDDIAQLALFLASTVSANITGQVIASDGGWTADGVGIAR